MEKVINMLNGKSEYSLKKAEFLVENAYEGGNMNYKTYCHDIDSIANILRSFIFINNISNYRTAPNYALFEYFTKPSPSMRKSYNGYGHLGSYYQRGRRYK